MSRDRIDWPIVFRLFLSRVSGVEQVGHFRGAKSIKKSFSTKF
jgi:hypothetical protein